jgi:hypothetical protein
MALFTGMNLAYSAGCPAGSYDNGDGTCLWGDGSTTDQQGNVLQAGSGGAGAPPGVSMMTAGTGPGISTGVGTAIGTAIGDMFGPAGAVVGGLLGAGAGTAVGNLLSPAAAGAALRKKHLNRSTYVTRRGGLTLVQKGTKMVTNRRRNAGNARAVRRAVGRLAMFNHLASKVHREIAKVAPHRRSSTTSCAPARRKGHREGCRCFACRR